MGESPRESELSDGSAREKILEAAFFQKLGEVLQEKQWRQAGAAVVSRLICTKEGRASLGEVFPLIATNEGARRAVM